MSKFDKAQLMETVIHPPFNASVMGIRQEVWLVIDQAYANIHCFYEAQTSDETLVIETMPGVICPRFACPIARVSIYVPSGTTILPSTVLMLGVPAQVAVCHEIVLVTPPQSDSSISPEVAYVTQLVRASAILTDYNIQPLMTRMLLYQLIYPLDLPKYWQVSQVILSKHSW
jgi:phosphoribosyl-ATP pyrophosphohydrolase/phosphoribosyl-AMP cyclohydrolase/histidinol dehydrogenase